jgi:hypothetical protein
VPDFDDEAGYVAIERREACHKFCHSAVAAVAKAPFKAWCSQYRPLLQSKSETNAFNAHPAIMQALLWPDAHER